MTARKHLPPPELPTKWRWLFHGFRWWVERMVRARFTALRVSKTSPPWPTAGPVLVALTHASWNDPLAATILSYAFDTDEQYAAIDAEQLKKHKLFSKIGFVPVEMHTLRGAADFLSAATHVLSRPSRVLWLTVQGRFADARERPLGVRPGAGHLARAMASGAGGVVVPVAIEYPFWDEPKPEILVQVGEILTADPGRNDSAKVWTGRIESVLTRAADELAAHALSRDPARFATVVGPDAAICGRRELRTRMLAAARGRPAPTQPSFHALASRGGATS